MDLVRNNDSRKTEAELDIKKELKKYPRLKILSKSILFITYDDTLSFKSGHTIKVQEDKKVLDVSLSLINKILSDKRYFDYMFGLFERNIKMFSMGNVKNGNIINNVSINTITIMNGIKKAVEGKFIKLEGLEGERYKELLSISSYEYYLNKHDTELFDIKIEGEFFEIPVSLIKNFIMMSDNKYQDFFDTPKEKYNGILKEYFVYAVIKYFDSHMIFENYLAPLKIVNRFNDLKLYKNMDVEAINMVSCANDNTKKIIKNIKIDEDLKNEILKGIPSHFELIEKAIYIYIKMCKLLTYNEEYYAYAQKGEVVKKHLDINNLINITLDNNEVVCYEFNALYVALLNEVGIIDYEMDGFVFDTFAGVHQNLNFRCDKFLINADSVVSILSSDLTKAKLNHPLDGLKCLNISEKTQNEFKLLITKVYSFIVREEIKEKSKSDKLTKVEHIETFEELLEEYKKVSEKPRITLEDKFQILINKINDACVIKVDIMAYILHLKRIIFSEEEKNKNIGISIVRNNVCEPATTCAIFTLNKTNIFEDSLNNTYFVAKFLFELQQIKY